MSVESKKSFWKRGNDTKLPGRPQPVARSSTESSVARSAPGGGVVRPRSKTFEEYAKETNDAWDDEGDLSDVTSPPIAETVTASTSKPPSTRTKADLKTRIIEAVKPRSSSTSSLGKSKDHSSTPSRNHRSPSPLASGHDGFSSSPPDDMFDLTDRETMKLHKFGKLLAGPNTSLDELRKASWSGIPSSVRATTWQLLCGYLPANIDRREETLQRKRQEYLNFVQQYYHMRSDPVHKDTFRQIHIDVPRMNPSIALFHQQLVQECFERILFIWSMRHPASGYVQGINDLVTPFFVVFLSYYISGDKDPESYDLSKLPNETLKMIEADSFWCLQKLLEGIQDNYTLAQPGIQAKLMALKDLVKRLDVDLDAHLARNMVDYLQFAFRWMNNLLMREFPLKRVIRLWDSYLSESDGFAKLHVYVCAALLSTYSDKIKKQRDFQELMTFLQNLPTGSWTDDDVQMLLSEAFKLKYMFADAPGHLQHLS